MTSEQLAEYEADQAAQERRRRGDPDPPTPADTRAEKEIQRDICNYLTHRGAWWDCPRMDKPSTVRPGRPDILACYRGRMLGLEAKTETGQLTDDQAREIAAINRAGGVGRLVRSVEEVRGILEDINEGIE